MKRTKAETVGIAHYYSGCVHLGAMEVLRFHDHALSLVILKAK